MAGAVRTDMSERVALRIGRRRSSLSGLWSGDAHQQPREDCMAEKSSLSTHVLRFYHESHPAQAPADTEPWVGMAGSHWAVLAAERERIRGT